MQSAVPHVLATLERTHDPERVPLVVEWAREAGLQVSLDLIYGTPGESLDDWARSLDAAIACDPDHLSAYSLIVEPGTKLARQIRSGAGRRSPTTTSRPTCTSSPTRGSPRAGYGWYEVSNWATDDAHRSRHNLAYWQGHDWWGVGPGAHSHVGGVRWWNVKHPAAYAGRDRWRGSPRRPVARPSTPRPGASSGCCCSRASATGCATAELSDAGRTAVAGLIADELVDAKAALRGSVGTDPARAASGGRRRAAAARRRARRG